MYFSPHSTIIPVSPLWNPYFSAKSGLPSTVTTSTFILSLAFVYCFAKSIVESSSEYPIKYIFMSLSIFFTFSLLSSVNVYNLSLLRSSGVKSNFCIP